MPQDLVILLETSNMTVAVC